ncbi:MAG: PEP-CTERM sorting domain-containing protein [Verrucomicrobiaceae bacterium]
MKFNPIFALLLMSPVAQAQLDSGGGSGSNLVGNGDFEINSYDYTKGSEVITEQDDAFGFERVDATAGATDWFMNSGVYRYTSDGDPNSAGAMGAGSGSIFQQFSFDSAGDYSLDFETFMDVPEGLGDPTAIGLSVVLGTTGVGASNLISDTFTESYDGQTSSRSYSFSVAEGQVGETYRLTFSRTGTEKALAYVDNVSVAAVPEPGSAMLVTLAGLVVLRRRRA